MHAGGGVAAKSAKRKRVDYRVSTATARNARRCQRGSSRRGYLGTTTASTNNANLAFLKSELALLIYLAKFGPQLPHGGRWSPANWLLHNLVRKRHRSRNCDSENAAGAVVSYRYLPALAAAGRSPSLFPSDEIGSRGSKE
jgi:hypothetical protein